MGRCPRTNKLPKDPLLFLSTLSAGDGSQEQQMELVLESRHAETSTLKSVSSRVECC